jgi:hypothetical protein
MKTAGNQAGLRDIGRKRMLAPTSLKCQEYLAAPSILPQLAAAANAGGFVPETVAHRLIADATGGTLLDHGPMGAREDILALVCQPD